MSGYPFALGLTVDYELSDAGLRVRTSAENLGSRAAPYGVGHHPYLSVGGADRHGAPDAARAQLRLIADERQIPISTEPVARHRATTSARRARSARSRSTPASAS